MFPKDETLRRKQQIHDQIAAYAEENAGTEFDLDPELEAAGIECLLRALND